jgi:predicted ArsR family transcriptional regulator
MADTALTPRQQEIKERLERGMTAIEVAEDLDISRNAVYQQIQAMRKKGELPRNFTPSGQPAREPGGTELELRDGQQDGAISQQLVKLLNDAADQLETFAQELRKRVQ